MKREARYVDWVLGACVVGHLGCAEVAEPTGAAPHAFHREQRRLCLNRWENLTEIGRFVVGGRLKARPWMNA
jgi:hypothetical protein